jgi:hypothetical protein
MMTRWSNASMAAVVAGLIAVAAVVAAVAGPLEDATAARSRGDYSTALRLLRPLAEQGNAAALSREWKPDHRNEVTSP